MVVKHGGRKESRNCEKQSACRSAQSVVVMSHVGNMSGAERSGCHTRQALRGYCGRQSNLEGDVGRRLGAECLLLLLELLPTSFDGDADSDLCLLLFINSQHITANEKRASIVQHLR